MNNFYRVTGKERSLAIVSEPLKNSDPFFYKAVQYDISKGQQEGYWDEIPSPAPGDWLWDYPEKPVSFKSYKKKYTRLPTPKKNTLYIQPIGEFGPDAPALEIVRQYAEIFFQLPTQLLPNISLREQEKSKNTQTLMQGETVLGSIVSRRKSKTQRLQLNTTHILKFLLKNKPQNAHCVMALTMVDLYPEDSWNFVFGEADLNRGIAVFSFARYSPLFEDPYADITEESARLMLLRGLEVMVHETGHMFGVQHCVYFNCVMNGSNSLEESDNQPIHLCPACLRKFQHHLGFEVHTRYFQLLNFYEENHLEQEAVWLRKRISIIYAGLSDAEREKYFSQNPEYVPDENDAVLM